MPIILVLAALVTIVAFVLPRHMHPSEVLPSVLRPDTNDPSRRPATGILETLTRPFKDFFDRTRQRGRQAEMTVAEIGKALRDNIVHAPEAAAGVAGRAASELLKPLLPVLLILLIGLIVTFLIVRRVT